MTAGIYAIRNKVNGRRYIGQSQDIEKRAQEHVARLDYAALCPPESQTRQSIFVKDWITHGSAAFEVDVLEIIEDLDTRKERERWFILNTPSEYNVWLKVKSMRALKINYPAENEATA